MKPPLLVTATLLAAGCAAPARVVAPRYPLIPLPHDLRPAQGAFHLDADTRVVVDGTERAEARAAAEHLLTPLRAVSGLPLPVGDAAPEGAANVLRLRVEPDAFPGRDATTAGAERYRLEVTAHQVALRAPTPAGLFRGVQTLRQLLPPELERASGAAHGWSPAPGGADFTTQSVTEWSIPAVSIEDEPRFAWRGMHLDVGRHLFPVSFIKKYIDLLALYRMNRFHWHLTEDQGWRIEIRKYPRLTQVGAWRRETIVEKQFDPYVGDRTPYGGFYTQDEVREVVAYAAERHITIVPEIEMPGHSRAALAAYPELGCTPGPFEVATRWGVFEEIYCPSEETFAFLEDVLTEVMALFPGEYIHIGGDEAPKKAWEESALAQEVIRREGLRDEHELQSWFIRRIERFLNTHGRRLVGWDEILEGGLAPGATVMSWRGMEGGIAAARQGHDVVMTPSSHVYFDHYQGDLETEPLAIGGFSPLEKVYAFEPIPRELSPDEARHVLGAQANMWTEYMKTPHHVEYMLLPRLLALSEVVWSPRDTRDWGSFLDRLPAHLERLAHMGANFRVPEPYRP